MLSFQSRKLLVERVREDGWTVAVAADAAGCSERTAYKWLARFAAEGVAGLEDRSSAPKTSPTRLAQGLVDAIEQLRRQNRWSPQFSKRRPPAGKSSRKRFTHRPTCAPSSP